MIIGISGHKQSGKSLTGKIIQWLIFQALFGGTEVIGIDSFQEWVDYADQFDNKTDHLSSWQIIQFADKLKDIVCIITGCTREQLEDEQFKRSFLPEQWNLWVVVLDNVHSFHSSGFITKEEAEEHEKKWENSIVETSVVLKRYTYREMLQYVGTDLFRIRFHPKTWVNATMAGYVKTFKEVELDDSQAFLDKIYPDWIITDVRFPDEAEAISERGGLLIRIERPSTHTTDTHASEISLDNYQGFDYMIINDDNMENLIKEIKKILKKERII